MDTNTQYLRQAVDQVLKGWEDFPGYMKLTNYVGIRDTANDRYALLAVSSPHGLQISHTLAHLEIRNGKIYVEFDGTEKGIANELVAVGVPKDHIVLAFYPTSIREMGEFAVA